MVVSFSSLTNNNSVAPHGKKQQCGASDDDLLNSRKGTIPADVCAVCKYDVHKTANKFILSCVA